MPEPKPRRWLQLHLSTAIMLMFVAGALVWANVQARNGSAYYTTNSASGPPPYVEQIRGFPFCVVVGRWESKTIEPEWGTTWDYGAAVVDLAIAAAALVGTAVGCEYITRRWRSHVQRLDGVLEVFFGPPAPPAR